MIRIDPITGHHTYWYHCARCGQERQYNSVRTPTICTDCRYTLTKEERILWLKAA